MEEILIQILRLLGAVLCFVVAGYALLFFDDDNAEF
tara:strand:+ start:242 stop:349 length:108 start_codon:yes stop_codon:yes gene_type:complete